MIATSMTRHQPIPTISPAATFDNGPRYSGSNYSSSDDDEDVKVVHNLRFDDTVSVRNHNCVMGDHPDTTVGVPIQLGWKYSHRTSILHDVPSKPVESISKERREEKVKESGFSSTEMKQAVKEVHKIRSSRILNSSTTSTTTTTSTTSTSSSTASASARTGTSYKATVKRGSGSSGVDVRRKGTKKSYSVTAKTATSSYAVKSKSRSSNVIGSQTKGIESDRNNNNGRRALDTAIQEQQQLQQCGEEEPKKKKRFFSRWRSNK